MKKNPLLIVAVIYLFVNIFIYNSSNSPSEEILRENNKIADNYQKELSIYTFNIKNVYNIQYDMQLYIGEKHNPFRILLDTGSSVLWVASPKCESCARAGMVNSYNCAQSSMCQEYPRDTRTLQYGIGNVEGFLTKDTVSLFPNEGMLFVEDQEFIQLNRIDEIKRLRADGIIGIGPKDSKDPDTLFENLKKQGKIKKVIFSLYLTGRSCKDDSQMIIGGYNSSLLVGELNYAPVIKQNSWTVRLNSMHIKDDNNRSIPLLSSTNKALIDSGTTSIGLGHYDTQELLKVFNSPQFKLECESKVTQQGVYQIQCGETNVNRYPRLSFTINQVEYYLDGEDYVQYCQSIQNLFLKSDCYLSFILDRTLDSERLVVLGDIFMVKYYCIFDMEDKKIGIGLAKQSKDKISVKSQAVEQLLNLLYCLIPVILTFVFLFYGLTCFGNVLLSNSQILNKIGDIFPFAVLDQNYDLNDKTEVEIVPIRSVGEQLLEEQPHNRNETISNLMSPETNSSSIFEE